MTSRRLECFRSLQRSLLRFTLPFGLALLGGASFLPVSAEEEQAGEARPKEDTGWISAGDEYPISGSPDARRNLPERPLKLWWANFPPTLRVDGPNTRLVQTTTLHKLIYETLIHVHPDTEEFLPKLAKEWRLETDFEKGVQTFWFRIDEKARFSDGSAVDAGDVHVSWWHQVLEDRNDPTNVMIFGQFEEPVIVDEHTIKVTTKELNWRLFLYFGAMNIYPKEYLTRTLEEGETGEDLQIIPGEESERLYMIPGKEYLDEYDWTWIPGSGPYEMLEGDLKKGQSLTLTRRDDWWAAGERWAQNAYNFKKIRWLVVRDHELHYQKFLAGEFDYYGIISARRWVEEVTRESSVINGWIQRRKIYNDAPRGFSGFVMNMRVPPFDDVRVRKAFAHLFNRKKLNEKLFFQEYEMIDSYIPGRDWGNGENNEKIEFDREKAEELLWEAGYQERDEDGYLIGPDGKRLELNFAFGSEPWERIWLVVKEDFEKAGIRFNIDYLEFSALREKIGERQFKIHFQSWSALRFPNPATHFASELADKKQNNNIAGFKSDEVDALLEEYDHTFDRARQKEITRKIDELVFREFPYALGWYAAFERILYWNRFGFPDTYWTRTGADPEDQILTWWWWEPAEIDTLDQAMAEGKKLPQGSVYQKPWAQWGKK